MLGRGFLADFAAGGQADADVGCGPGGPPYYAFGGSGDLFALARQRHECPAQRAPRHAKACATWLAEICRGAGS